MPSTSPRARQRGPAPPTLPSQWLSRRAAKGRCQGDGGGAHRSPRMAEQLEPLPCEHSGWARMQNETRKKTPLTLQPLLEMDHPRAGYYGFRTHCLRSAEFVTSPNARIAFSCGVRPTGWGSHPQGSDEAFNCVEDIASPFSSLLVASDATSVRLPTAIGSAWSHTGDLLDAKAS